MTDQISELPTLHHVRHIPGSVAPKMRLKSIASTIMVEPRLGAKAGDRRKSIFGVQRRNLSLREEVTIREIFKLFDEDGNGTISRDELAHMLQTILNDDLEKKALDDMISMIEEDEKEPISFQKFHSHLEQILGHKADVEAGEVHSSRVAHHRGEAEWLKLGEVITTAAKAASENRGGFGAYNYRQKWQDREIQKKKIASQHNAMVEHFHLRRLSVDPSNDHSLAAAAAALAEGKLMPAKQRCVVSFAPFDPDATWRRGWDILIMLIICMQVVYVPFMVAFRPETSAEWQIFEYFVDTIFVTDLLMTFNTSVRVSRMKVVEDRREIAKIYLKGWFCVDLLASIPVELILGLSSPQSREGNGAEALSLMKGLRMPRLLRLLRMMRLFRIIRGDIQKELVYFMHYSSHANTLKLVRLLCAIMLICHYMACCFHSVASSGLWMRMEECNFQPSSDSTSSDATTINQACDDASVELRYITSFYTIFLLINGEETRPKTDEERVFAIFAIVAGAIIVATIFGNVSILIMNFSANQLLYRKKMESLYENMSHMDLPAGLKARIVAYYDQIWKNYRSLSGNTSMFTSELNPTLASEVHLSMRTGFVMDIPFFSPFASTIIKDLVMILTTEVFMPGDYIINKGVPVQTLYIVSNGRCEVLSNSIRRETTLNHTTTTMNNATGDGDARVPDDFKPQDAKSVLPAFKPLAFKGVSQKHESRPAPGKQEWIIPITGQDPKPEPTRKRFGSWIRAQRSRKPGGEQLVAIEKVVKILTVGSFFGEAGLVWNAQASFGVRAKLFTELHLLARDNMIAVLQQYPEEFKSVNMLIVEHCNKLPPGSAVACRQDDFPPHDHGARASSIGTRAVDTTCQGPGGATLEKVNSRLIALELKLLSWARVQGRGS